MSEREGERERERLEAHYASRGIANGRFRDLGLVSMGCLACHVSMSL